MKLYNIKSHPSNSRWFIVYYNSAPPLQTLEKEMKQAGIPIVECDVETENTTEYHYIVFDRQQLELVKGLNQKIMLMYRQKFIPTAFFRWLVLSLTILAVVLAIIGWYKSNA